MKKKIRASSQKLVSKVQAMGATEFVLNPLFLRASLPSWAKRLSMTLVKPLFIFSMGAGELLVARYWPGDSFHRTVYDHAT